MARKKNEFSHETMSKRRRGFQLRDPRQARRADRSWRQGAGREARPQRSLPVRLGTPVSRPAASLRAGFIERDTIDDRRRPMSARSGLG
jgi:hypothetical protein